MRSTAIAIASLLLTLCPSLASAQDPPLAYDTVPRAHVHFESDTPGIALSRADGLGGWTELGMSPCDLSLPMGALELALSSQHRTPVRVPITLDMSDGARLLGHYESRQELRELGVGVLVGTIIATLIGLALGAAGFLARSIDLGVAGLVAAGAVGVAGGTTGIALATLEDLATIDLQ